MSECDKRWSALALAKNYHLILTFPGPIKLSSSAGTLEEKERAPQLLPWSAREELAVEKWEGKYAMRLLDTDRPCPLHQLRGF